jgi:O-antigen ligase/tetratricopeptide (TPR) repeat protein
MPSPDRRSLFLPTLLLAGLLISLPWGAGGRSPIGQVSLVLVLVLAGVAGILARGMSALAKPSPLLLAGGILVAGSAFHTIYPDRTIQSLLSLLAYLLAGVLAADAAREESRLERILLTAILASGTLVTIIGVIRLLWHSDEGLYATLLTGPFGYPNAMAGFLLLTGGAALALASEGQNSAFRAGTMAVGGLALVGLLLTHSRGALLAAGAALLIWVIVKWRGELPRRRLWIWLGGCSLLAVLVWLSWKFGGPLVNTGRLAERQEVSSLVWRWQILQWTWAMARDHPWWGVGPGAFPVALTHYQRIPYVSSENPHNLYLELAAEYGLPTAMLAVGALVAFLGRVGKSIRRTPDSDPARRRQAALLATLIAFALHSLVDLDWSYPAIAATVATILGMTSAHLQRGVPREAHAQPLWQRAFIVLLLAAALMSITRYYASTLVTWARLALSNKEAAVAQHELTWALRLNPVSFPAHHWMAWARLLSGDLRGAAEVAEQAIRISPSDPNGHYLAGEVAAAFGLWNMAEDRFRAAVDLAPSAQLRFHAALVESAANSSHAKEARFLYDRADSIFTEERVLNAEARCLMPGDRYLLARMGRIAARAFGQAGDLSRQEEILERAKLLAQPDPRGICVTRGLPGQTSPEAAMDSFWRALADGGWPKAEQFLSRRLRASRPNDDLSPWHGENQPRRAHVAWIAALQGDEHEVNLRFDVEFEAASDSRINRCAQVELRLIGENWFVNRLPVLDPVSCRP